MQSDKKPADDGVLNPEARLQVIKDVGNSVEVDFNVPARRYYKSGLEMVRMANVYLEEGSLENAFSLYMKFMTLFLEKIRAHPEFPTVSPEVRAKNYQRLREVLPKAEKLKVKLLEQYTEEYKRYLKDKKRREQERLKLEKELDDQKRRLESADKTYNPAATPDWLSQPNNLVTPVPPLPPDLLYPDTFAGPTNTAEEPSAVISKPGVDRSKKPASLMSPMFNASKYLLRTVIVPGRLMVKFLHLAHRNTEQNIETCGILSGKLEQNQLVITHLLIPKQHGSPDACVTKNEEEIFDYQDQHELVTFGWIHTHPTQTAFLSSVDLHTHCSYQRLMPEALAIVCAPKYKEHNFFCLTPTYGLDFIANCRQTGFHPHPSEPPLYMVAEHMKLDNSANIEVVDLRT